MGQRLERAGQAENANIVAGCVASLREKLNIQRKLTDMGVEPEDFSRLADFAFHDPCLATNPREPSLGDIEDIFRQINE